MKYIKTLLLILLFSSCIPEAPYIVIGMNSTYSEPELAYFKIPYEYNFESNMQEVKVVFNRIEGALISSVYERQFIAPSYGSFIFTDETGENPVDLKANSTYVFEVTLISSRYGKAQEVPGLTAKQEFDVIP